MKTKNEYLAERITAMRKEIESLELAYTWLAFAAVTGLGGVIVLVATQLLEGK